MKIAIVILNWNGKDFLEKFLPTVIRYSQKDAEVIVADNCSTDYSVAWIQENHPTIRIIQNSENGGFAKGYNDALSQVDADYYVLLNSDIEVTENWIDPVIRLMESDPLIAACQPKIRSWHRKEMFEYAGAAGGYIDHNGYPFCRGRIFMSLEKDRGQYNDNCEVFWATGACLFIRADIYHKAGGLDNDFFAHMEEIDLCWRLKSDGYKIMYCGESLVFHVGGGTLPKESSRKTYLNFRNNLILLYKNLPEKRIYPVFINRFFLDAIAAFRFLIGAGFKDFNAVIRAHIDFIKSKKRFKAKRKPDNKQKISGIYEGNIVFDHFLRGKKLFNQIKSDRFTK